MSDNINKKFIDWDNLEYVLNKMQDFLVSHSAMEHRLDVFYNAREIVTDGIKYANDVDSDNNQKYNKEDYDSLTYKSITGVNEGLDDLEQKKADKATTLAGYGITDAYTKTETNNAISDATKGKADKATTLAGYGITDAYTMEGTNKAITDAFNDFATKVSDDNVVNSYKELIDYAAEHGAEFTELVGVVGKKQDKLEDNVNIKTINGVSILGTGNIVIEGGSDNADLSDIKERLDKIETALSEISTYTYEK